MARIPSILEPAGLSRSDGKRPDGVTIAPWKSGRPLVGMSHVQTLLQHRMRYSWQHRRRQLGAVTLHAALAEKKMKTKYETIAQTHLFCPIAIETSGVFGIPDAYAILCDLARRINN